MFFSIMLYFSYYLFTFNLFEWIINTTRVHMHTCTKTHTRELKYLNTWTNTQYPFTYKNIGLQIINISSSAFNHNYNYFNDMNVSFQTKCPSLYYCIVYLCYVFFRNFLIVFVNLCKPKYRKLYIKCFLYNYVTCLPTVPMTCRDTCFSIYAISTDYMHPLVHDINNNLDRILYLNLWHLYSNVMRNTYLQYIIFPLYNCVSTPYRKSILFDS